jgi:hypothetical protein
VRAKSMLALSTIRSNNCSLARFVLIGRLSYSIKYRRNQNLSRALMRVGEWLQQMAHLNIFKRPKKKL